MPPAQDLDCTWLERELADIGVLSARLPWHRESGTRWEAAERVDLEWSDQLGALPRVDLHGLDQRLTREVVTRVLAGRKHLRAPAVRFVTGSGNHSEAGRGVLGNVVEACVGEARGVDLHPTGELPWRDVVWGAPAPQRTRRRGAVSAPPPEPGVLGRVFQGLVGALLSALFGAVARTFARTFGAPGRAFARLFKKKKRTRKRRRR